MLVHQVVDFLKTGNFDRVIDNLIFYKAWIAILYSLQQAGNLKIAM
jgi:hypothetical protein